MPHHFKIRIDDQNPVHTRFTVFGGSSKEFTHANCGTLCMRNEEFQDFCRVLSYSVQGGTVDPVIYNLVAKESPLEL